MPIDSKLLEILRCPLTKQALFVLSQEKIDELNQKISAGDIHYEDGTIVNETINEGLITANGNRVYRVDAGIPIMLHGQSVSLKESKPTDVDVKD